MINYEDFAKVEMKIGEIKSVEIIEGADKLLKLMVDVGEEAPRQVVSGIREFFPDPQVLVGTKCPFVTNLEHRTIRGVESRGMILAASTAEGGFALLVPSSDVSPGTKLK